MSTIEELKYRLIGEVNSIHDEEYLEALLRLVGAASPSTKKVPLSKEEISMIEEGLAAYDRGEFLTNEEVEKRDEEWLK